MKEENQAAQVDPLDAFVNEALDQALEQPEEETTITDSATVEEDAKSPEENPLIKSDDPDGVKKRIDKITADKYAEKRRADELQKKIDALEAAQPKESLKKPELGDPEIDYDEDAFNEANLKYEIEKGVQETLAKQQAAAKAEQQKAESEKVLATFNERVNALGKSDFDEKANAIPILPAGVADAIMQSELGAEMVYHLGSNLEKADAIANMSPAMAIMELGKLSTQLKAKPEIKTSAAPDPIEPVKAGSSLSSKIDDEMPIDEWMRKYG